MKVFEGIIVSLTFVFAPVLTCQPQANPSSTPNTHSIQVTRRGNTEPFCPPKELREERFCPDRETPESTRFGCTPLMRAAEGGNLVQVRALLDKGADVNPAPHGGHTALMLAAGKDQLEVVKILLKAGANPNAVAFGHGGIPGWAWMFAMDRCNKHWLEMTEALLAAGAALNPKTIYPSPLGYAIGKNDAVMIEALLKRGADVNLADAETGDTLLMSAAQYSTPEVVQVLIEAGANVKARNKLDQTALTIGGNKDNSWRREIVALLIEHGAKH